MRCWKNDGLPLNLQGEFFKAVQQRSAMIGHLMGDA
jgi:hypothetical protein